MKSAIFNYKIYLFGRDKGDYEWASMELGQKIIMAMASDDPPKFIRIGNSLINTSAIASISEDQESPMIKNDYRELTLEEEKTLKLFERFKGNSKLLN